MSQTSSRRPDSRELAETLTLTALGLLLIVTAVARRSFIGDGIRHLSNVMAAGWPPVGEARWLLFPTLVWAIDRPFIAVGWISTIDAAIRPFLATSVLTGIVYLLSLRLWLRAEGYDAATRTSALLLAAVTIPFLALYSDIAEVQLAAAAVVAALALARSRCGAGACSSGLAIAVVAVIAVASLVYQGLIVSLAFVPLVIPLPTLRRGTVLLASAAIVASVPLVIVGARVWAGDTLAMAMTTAVSGEMNPLTRTFMGVATPLKWVVAVVAGPPQAIVGLDGFRGLRALAAALRDPRTTNTAVVNLIRLGIGGVLVAAIAVAIVRRRDWRLALAFAGVVALPMIRNDQYNYVKFFALWPVIVAIAATAFDPRQVAAVAALVFSMNGTLVAQEIIQGRRVSAEMSALYVNASATTCFFTSDWGAPFRYRWPGTTAAVIETLATGKDPTVQARQLTDSIARCFCDASAVWTDTTVDSAPVITLLTDHFQYAAFDLREILLLPSEGVLVGNSPVLMYAYSANRQADACRVVRAVELRR